MRGKDNVDIIVLLPHKKISIVQELMMTTVLESNVHVYAGTRLNILITSISVITLTANITSIKQ